MKVGIVGTGDVGSSAAFAMIMAGIARELVLVDPDEDLAEAQARDLEDATPFGHPVRVAPGDYPQLAGAGLVVLCCGARQHTGESRLTLLGRNAAIFREVTPKVLAHAPDALLLVVSNPVDVLTDLVCRVSGLPEGRVFGTGTTLDTARFRARLASQVGVSPRSIHAYVLGEHGDSEVLVWSSAAVGGLPLRAFAEQAGRPITPEVQAGIDDGVRHGAARIIHGKRATYYGIAGCVAHIVRCLRDHEDALLTVTAPAPDWGRSPAPCLSLPRVIGAGGVSRTLAPTLSPEERRALERSATILWEAGQQL